MMQNVFKSYVKMNECREEDMKGAGTELTCLERCCVQHVHLCDLPRNSLNALS